MQQRPEAARTAQADPITATCGVFAVARHAESRRTRGLRRPDQSPNARDVVDWSQARIDGGTRGHRIPRGSPGSATDLRYSLFTALHDEVRNGAGQRPVRGRDGRASGLRHRTDQYRPIKKFASDGGCELAAVTLRTNTTRHGMRVDPFPDWWQRRRRRGRQQSSRRPTQASRSRRAGRSE